MKCSCLESNACSSHQSEWVTPVAGPNCNQLVLGRVCELVLFRYGLPGITVTIKELAFISGAVVSSLEPNLRHSAVTQGQWVYRPRNWVYTTTNTRPITATFVSRRQKTHTRLHLAANSIFNGLLLVFNNCSGFNYTSPPAPHWGWKQKTTHPAVKMAVSVVLIIRSRDAHPIWHLVYLPYWHGLIFTAICNPVYSVKMEDMKLQPSGTFSTINIYIYIYMLCLGKGTQDSVVARGATLQAGR
jgi:hypothetical protein